MRILFWTDGFWPRLGGIETQGFHFVQGMQQRGHQYIVLAQRDHPSWKDDEQFRGISIKRIDFNAIIEKRQLGLMRETEKYIEWILKEFRPDLIHLNASVGGSAFVFLLFMKLFKLPTVLTLHAPYLLEGKFPPLIEKITTSIDQIYCVSDWVLTEMRKHLPHLSHKFRRIYNGLDAPKTTPRPLSFSPPILLAFGRLSWEKGFETALRAFALLKKRGSNAQLIVGGGGPERENLEQLANELGLNHSVQFTGVLSEEERLATFNKATIVLVPSILESFGLVILEAMQLERPVIASRIEGAPEVVSEGETGLLVPMKDPEALSNAIETLLQDPKRAIEMGIRGKERANQFTLQQNLDQYERVYNENFVLG